MFSGMPRDVYQYNVMFYFIQLHFHLRCSDLNTLALSGGFWFEDAYT